MSQYDCDVEGHSPVYTVDRPYCKECGADLFTADLFTIEQPKFECWICKTNADYIDLLMHDEPDHCLSECVDCGQCHLCNAFDACFNEHTAVQKAFEASEEEMEATLANLRETEVRAQQAELEIKFIDGSTGYWCRRAIRAEEEAGTLRAKLRAASDSIPMERIEEIVEGVRPKSPLMDNFSIGKNAACDKMVAAFRKETQ